MNTFPTLLDDFLPEVLRVGDNTTLFSFHFPDSAHSKILVCRFQVFFCMVKLSAFCQGCVMFFEEGGRGGWQSLFYKLPVKLCPNELNLANSTNSIELSRLTKLRTLHIKGGGIYWNLLWLKFCCSSEGIVCIPLYKIMNTGAVSCESDQHLCPILVVEIIRVKCSSRETCATVVSLERTCFCPGQKLWYNHIKYQIFKKA